MCRFSASEAGPGSYGADSKQQDRRPDGAQEYAVFHDDCKTDEGEAPSKFMQVESLTVSWMDSAQELRDLLQKLHDAPSDPEHSVLMGAYSLRFDHTPACRLCA